MTNSKSNTPFRLVPKSTTLDDLERPIRTLLHKRCVVRSPPQKIEWTSMKTDPYYQRQKCRPMTLVSGGIRFVRIFAEVPGEGRHTTVGLSTTAIFCVFAGYFFGYIREEVGVIIWRYVLYVVRRRLFSDPKMHDLTNTESLASCVPRMHGLSSVYTSRCGSYVTVVSPPEIFFDNINTMHFWAQNGLQFILQKNISSKQTTDRPRRYVLHQYRLCTRPK